MKAETSVKQCEDKIKQVCATFLGNEWTENGNVLIQRLPTGSINRTFRCTFGSVTKKEVIVKIYGSEFEEVKELVSEEIKITHEEIPFNSEAAEILIIDRFAARGMAPKLYGLFSGGRIEQFIEGRNPTVNDFEDKTLFSTVARNLAKYHNMDIPLSKIPKWVEGIAKSITSVPPLTDYSHIPGEQKDVVRRLFEFNLVSEFDWVLKLNLKINSPIVFSHNDLHMCNMILRETYSTSDERIMFLDYESSCYNYRGFDMAHFFTVFEFSIFAGAEKVEIKYTENKCDKETLRYFIEHYLTVFGEERELSPEIDTVEHIEMEIDFFQLVVYLAFMYFDRSSVVDPKRNDPCAHVQPLLNCYETEKQRFLSKYPQFNDV